MAQVKIIIRDRYKRADIQNIASKNGCKLINAVGDEVIYEKENLDSFMSELKQMQDLIPSIDIIPISLGQH